MKKIMFSDAFCLTLAVLNGSKTMIRQLLFDKMKEQGLLWNAEEKKVEKIRWRAKKGEEYHFMNTDLTTVKSTELGDDVDTNRYDALNYFHTEEQTSEAAKRVKETLRKYHEEIGE